MILTLLRVLAFIALGLVRVTFAVGALLVALVFGLASLITPRTA